MSPAHIRVATGTRLHFGLLSFGQAQVPSFGGAGVMIDHSGCTLAIEPGSRWRVTGAGAERAEAFARRFLSAIGSSSEPACTLHVERIPPPHRGLGSGTQIALAVALALAEFQGQRRTISKLARQTGRGGRSSVGVFGFEQGGLIVEEGHPQPGSPSRLEARVQVPNQWRFILARLSSGEGISGPLEQRAFEHLPPVPLETTRRLRQLAMGELVPAARAASAPRFGQALWQYGLAAGECFAAVQGGCFASREIAELVAALRELGALGVGQSSWGPTVFALSPDAETAQGWIARLADRYGARLEATSTAPRNVGAELWIDGRPAPLPAMD